ncbi:ATP-binding protein [Paragemmobacter straminiformis]|uniref:histidine kinase n=1 Tax=Paragemmobacter straminiformis TaxID=2045119 RepID=A0A842I407_9RHOB|nr:ATP-binding protein [Gemmobacter straminiformis]MBC2834580.1 two-component sensor histidine kinase [Gemmobacter straminiformis]
MKGASIRIRSAVALSLIVTALWLATAALTAKILSDEMDEVFDSALQETGQRILQLAVVDVLNREEAGITRRVTGLAAHEEHFTYVVRDQTGAVLLASHRAEPADFPLFDAAGFHDAQDLRFYQEAAVSNTVILTIAEPLSHRREVAFEMVVALALPLLVMVPLSVVAIFYGLGFGLRPLDRLRDQLALRGATRLTPLPREGLPAELRPVADTVNDLLARLEKSFAAERSFAANAAHELRTPLAGALAQVQRLRQQSADAETRRRADEVEATLKRLTRLSEKLMQLARAEGARLLVDRPTDIGAVLSLVARDFRYGKDAERLDLSLPDAAVMSTVDPDAVAIVARNLIENALRHGGGSGVAIRLDASGLLAVENGGAAIPPDQMARLTDRFVRGDGGEGSGLGLAIVQTIAGRIGSKLSLHSPIPGRTDGFRATIDLIPDPSARTDRTS